MFLFLKEALKLWTDPICPIWAETGIYNFRNYGHRRTAEIVIFCRTECTPRHASNSSSHIIEAPYEAECSIKSFVCARLQHPGSSLAAMHTWAVLAANPAPWLRTKAKRVSGVQRGTTVSPATSQGFSSKKKECQMMQSCGNLRTLTILL